MNNNKNFGDVIKNLAIVYGVAVSIIFLIVGVAYAETSAGLGILYIIIGICSAICGGLLICGFGILIDKTINTNQKINELVELKRTEKKSVEKVVRDVEEETENKAVNNKGKTKQCTICLKEVEKDSVFCKYCGTKLK